MTIFEQCAILSGLVSEEELNAAKSRLTVEEQLPPEDYSRKLAEILVTRGIINRWQSRQLLAGSYRFSLGHYRIFDQIGHGGLGRVFKARHKVTEQVYAIKVLRGKENAPSASEIENFQYEIKNLAQLHHLNIVSAIDSGFEGNVHYFVTEYVPGPDLRKLVRQYGPLNQEFAASVIVQVAKGLCYIHEKGIVHRDVKPANILVAQNGIAKLSDFGFASTPSRARSMKIVGSADFISPDQTLTPDSPQPVFDIYSLGCTLYYAVTGQVPYPQGKAEDKVKRHRDLKTFPVYPCILNPEISQEFAAIIACMMAKRPEERIASALEVVQFLSPWSDGTPVPISTLDKSAVDSELPDADDRDLPSQNTKSVQPPEVIAQPVGSSSEVSQGPKKSDSSSQKSSESVSASVKKTGPAVLLTLDDAYTAPPNDSEYEVIAQRKRNVVPPPLPRGIIGNISPNAHVLQDSDMDSAEIDLENDSASTGASETRLGGVIGNFKKTALRFFKKRGENSN